MLHASQAECSPPLLVKIYPTRAKALAELHHRMLAQPAAAPAPPAPLPTAYSAYHGHGGTGSGLGVSGSTGGGGGGSPHGQGQGGHHHHHGPPKSALPHRPSPSRFGRKSNGGLLPGQADSLTVQPRTVGPGGHPEGQI